MHASDDVFLLDAVPVTLATMVCLSIVVLVTLTTVVGAVIGVDVSDFRWFSCTVPRSLRIVIAMPYLLDLWLSTKVHRHLNSIVNR